MAATSSASEDLNRSSASSSSKRSIHQVLGSGFVADVMLWRNRTASICIAIGSTAFWILFEFAGYSVLSLIANSFLLLVTIIFFWAKSAALLNRPPPPIPNLEISNEVVEKAMSKFRARVNRVLSVARDIGIERDRKVFAQVIVALWIVSYIGSLFSFYTFVYFGVVLSLSIPVLYEKHQDHADEKLKMLHDLIIKHFGNVLGKISGQTKKEKKTQ